MITVYPVLRQRMEEHGVSGRELARVAGVSRIAFFLKMWGIKRWSLPEAVKICGFFNTPDAVVKSVDFRLLLHTISAKLGLLWAGVK